MSETTVTGPYKYEGDMHPSFRIDSDDRIIASVYASDGDTDAAEKLAHRIAGLLATPAPERDRIGARNGLRDETGALIGGLVVFDYIAGMADYKGWELASRHDQPILRSRAPASRRGSRGRRGFPP